MLAGGAVAGLAAPATVCAAALHTSWRLAVLAVAGVATALAVLFLGIT